MMWEITDRGFLGKDDPLRFLAATANKYCPLVARLEWIAESFPAWIEERRVREELVSELRDCWNLLEDDFFNGLTEPEWERLMHLYSYMASAYVYSRHDTPAIRLPSEIAVPLVEISSRLNRKPILSYASYCLTNWERKNPDLPICLENIRLLTNFCTPDFGKRDEDWFILVHVEIEAGAAPGVYACRQLLDASPENSQGILDAIHSSLVSMNRTMNRMPEQCSPDNYFRWVRPYIFSFKDVVYEGCFDDKPQTFRGETGAQSTVVPIFLAALGIRHQNSVLTQHLEIMREYMPAPHREFLQKLLIQQDTADVSLRACCAASPVMKDAYNECVTQIIQFRAKHFEYAVNYIHNKVDSPEGTGGTPYIPWLKQLKEETEAQLL